MIPMEIHMAAIKQRADKVDRHRQRMRAAGFRPVQFWVPDTRGADFAERVRQQCLKLKGDPAELDALRFVEEAAAQVEGWQGSEAILSRFRRSAERRVGNECGSTCRSRWAPCTLKKKKKVTTK